MIKDLLSEIGMCRRTVFIAVLSFTCAVLLQSCNGGQGKKSEVNNKTSQPSSADEHSDLERFDVEKFNKDLVDNERNLIDNNGNILHQYKTKDGFHEDLTRPKSYFFLSRSFYKDGRLEEKGERFHGDGFLKGIWTSYDEAGHVIKQVDYDAPFKFNWDSILVLMKDKGIDPADNFTYVNREVNASGPVWIISWDTKAVTSDGKKILKGVFVNGETGNTSKEETENFEE
jgi:antitoxin component YwqK of YwqJK toxin-antitoxin module